MSTHIGTSYLDIRIRLHLENAGIINLHLLAIPVYDRHTGQVIFEVASKAMFYVHHGGICSSVYQPMARRR